MALFAEKSVINRPDQPLLTADGLLLLNQMLREAADGNFLATQLIVQSLRRGVNPTIESLNKAARDKAAVGVLGVSFLGM